MISRIFEGNRGSVQYFPAGKCRPGVDLRARERPPNAVDFYPQYTHVTPNKKQN